MDKINKTVGSPLWAFDRFRESALSKLLDDLLNVEDKGFNEDQCKKVRMTLERILNLCSAIPDKSFFRKSIYGQLSDFKKIYINWNDINGDDKKSILKRKKSYEKLRGKRRQLATTIRKNAYILMNEIDLKLMKSLYEAFGDLVEAFPAIFKNLSKAVSTFFKKLPDNVFLD